MIRVISSPSISTTGLAAANRLAGVASTKQMKEKYKESITKKKNQRAKKKSTILMNQT